MPRYRLSPFARADIAGILTASVRQWGVEARRRYSALLVAAMRKIAADPDGPGTRDRADLRAGTRSFPIRYARANASEVTIGRPVHVLYYRAVTPGLIEIIRVLHERMDPSRHLPAGEEPPREC